MITPSEWMASLLARLRADFERRLLYVGLQGSHRRGEATESSDIDVVTVLDTVSVADLERYRTTVQAMPEGEKACGFLCGREELSHWPRHEIFQLVMDTGDYFGRLSDFVPQVGRTDIVEGARIGAANLYHQVVHGRLYAGPEERCAVLAGAFKAAFFVLRLAHYLESGQYAQNKRELVGCLDGDERQIAAASAGFSTWMASHTEAEAFFLLLDWCRRFLIRQPPE